MSLLLIHGVQSANEVGWSTHGDDLALPRVLQAVESTAAAMPCRQSPLQLVNYVAEYSARNLTNKQRNQSRRCRLPAVHTKAGLI